MSLMPMSRNAYGQPSSNDGILMQDISRQRKLAEELRRQGSEELKGQMVSGHYVAPSWTQGLAKILQSGFAASQNSKLDKEEKDYSSQKNKAFADILNGNKAKKIEGAPTVTSSMPAYEPNQLDQFGSPLPGIQREAQTTSTPTFTNEAPEDVQARQQAAVLEYMQQYGNTPEAQYMLAQLNKQDDRSYAKGEKLDDRSYQGGLRKEDREFKVADREDQQEFTSGENRLSREQQAALQQAGFSHAEIMQINSQGFQAGENALNRNFQAGQNQLSRDNSLAVASAKVAPKNKGLSVTAQKELIDAEDGIQGSKEALKAFDKALTLNKKAWGGAGSGKVATGLSVLPDALRPDGADATKELDNVLQGVQGSSSQPASVRKGIFERAKAAAEQRIKYNTEKAKQLRNGTYFTEEGGINIDEPTPASNGGWSIKPL
jgi:hypothetical protein